MSLFSSLIPEPYGILVRIGIIILVVGGAFTTGYVKGMQHEQNKQLQKTIQDQQKIITVTKTQTVIDTNAVSKLQSQIDVLRNRNYVLQNEIKTLPDNLCLPNGNLSPSFVQYYNSSIASDSGDATTKIHAGASKSTTSSN